MPSRHANLRPFSLLLASVFGLIGAFALLMPLQPAGNVHNEAAEEKEEGPGNPGWQEQRWAKKKHPDEPIPRRFFSRLQRAYAANKTGMTNLQNVQEAGPENVGGRTRGLIVDHNDPDHLIAGGVSGGIWHSIDRGTNWFPANDQAPTLSVTDITQSPFNANVLYYGTGEALGNSSDLPGEGVFKSTDNGFSWTQLPATDVLAFDNIWSVRHSLVDSNTLYVGTDIGGLRRSTDGGQTFETVLNSGGFFGFSVKDIAVFPSGRVIAAVADEGLYSSPDGSPGSFTKLGGGLPTSDFRRIAVDYCESQPNVIYAAFEDELASSFNSAVKGVWKSTDGGQSWSQTSANPNDNHNFLLPWYAFLFEVAPDDPDFVMIGSVEMAFTINGGNTWTSARNSHVDYHVATFHPDFPSQIFVGNDGGIYRYNQSTISFQVANLNNGYNVTQYYAGTFFPQDLQAWGGTQDNGTNRFENGSATFDRILGGDGSYTAVNQQTPSIAYASSQRGQIRKTTNAKSLFPNFSSVVNNLDADNDGDVDDDVWFINPYEINPADGSQLYYVTRDRLWRSTNGAQSWTPLTSFVNDLFAVGVTPEANPTVYTGGSATRFFRIDDPLNAQPGDEVSLTGTAPNNLVGSFISCITPHPTQAGIVFLSFSDFSSAPRVYMVINANTNQPSWVDISGDLPTRLPVNWIDVDPQNPTQTLVAGTDFGLYSTTDGGATWVKEPGIPNAPVEQVKIRPSDRKIFAFTHGRGLWTADLPAPTARGNETDDRQSQLTAWPNPAREHLSLRLEGHSGPARIRLVTPQGRQLLAEEHQVQAGRAIRLQLRNAASGLYFAEVHFRDGTSFRRRVIVR